MLATDRRSAGERRLRRSRVGLVARVAATLRARESPATFSPRVALLLAGVSLSCFACTASREQVLSTTTERAAFDLECPRQDIKATQLGDTVVIGRTANTAGLERTVVGASGCGKKSVYVVECVTGVGESRCNAQMNADAAPAP